MGGRLGKLGYYSYDMSDSNDKEEGGGGGELNRDTSCPSGTCVRRRNSNDHHSDDQSDEKSSTGSRETTCVVFKSKSSKEEKENASKKRKGFRTGGGNGGGGGKKDFFGKRNKKWPMRKSKGDSSDVEKPPTGSLSCICTMYRRTNSEGEPGPSAAIVPSHQETIQRILGRPSSSNAPNPVSRPTHTPIIDLSRFNPADYPIDDEDERLRQQREKEMREGVELSALLGSVSLREHYPAHSQVDFIHYLVPDLKEITNCSFYWGKIDRYEAEKLLEGKSEGTFLLRDSAQEEYLFSVSFRRYNRSLHARIEQWNNQFSFDSHDPSVFSSSTVTGLIEHYKDPSCCMFFEPMLTTPLHRNFPFDLQHLARASICSRLKYDSVNALNLPKPLKMYLKEYHYKQRVRMRPLE